MFKKAIKFVDHVKPCYNSFIIVVKSITFISRSYCSDPTDAILVEISMRRVDEIIHTNN